MAWNIWYGWNFSIFFFMLGELLILPIWFSPVDSFSMIFNIRYECSGKCKVLTSAGDFSVLATSFRWCYKLNLGFGFFCELNCVSSWCYYLWFTRSGYSMLKFKIIHGGFLSKLEVDRCNWLQLCPRHWFHDFIFECADEGLYGF